MDKHLTFQSIGSWSLTVWWSLLNNSVLFRYNLHLSASFPLPLLLSERVSACLGTSVSSWLRGKGGFKPKRVHWIILANIPSGLWGSHAGTSLESRVPAICTLWTCILMSSPSPELLAPCTACTGHGDQECHLGSPVGLHLSQGGVSLLFHGVLSPVELEPHSGCAQGTGPCPSLIQAPQHLYGSFLIVVGLGACDWRHGERHKDPGI